MFKTCIRQPTSRAFILGALLAYSLSVQATETPNIILIMADDMGYECVGANGSTSYQTPNIDKLARQGMRFENCHAQAICTPSRVKLMSGKTNQLNYVDFRKLDRSVRTFGHYFQDAGYQTAVAGKWQLDVSEDSPLHFGFDEALLWQHSKPRLQLPTNGEKGKRDSRYSNPWLQSTHQNEAGQVVSEVKQHLGKYGPDLVSDFGVDFIERNHDRPFLLYYPMLLVHCPFTPTPDSATWVSDAPGSADYKGEPDNFPDMVAYADKIVGKIADKIDALGLSDNTVFVFTGDNGTDKPIVSQMGRNKIIGSKGNTIRWGTNVPLIVRWPEQIRSGSVNRDLVDFSDFLPTLCDIAEIEIPANHSITEHGVTGQSFAPQLLGNEGEPRNSLYCWYKPLAKTRKAKAFAHNHRYKLYADGRLFDLENDVQEQSPIAKSVRDSNEKTAAKELNAVIKQYAQMKPEVDRKQTAKD